MTTVMLLDDHEVVRAGLRALLGTTTDLHVVAEAGTGRQALHRATEFAPDAVVLDVRLPDASGVAACRQIRAETRQWACGHAVPQRGGTSRQDTGPHLVSAVPSQAEEPFTKGT